MTRGQHSVRATCVSLPFVLVVLFVACCILRIVLASFTKTIDILPDEMRYLDLMTSLYSQGALIERGATSCFQKILYPLLICPAMLWPSGFGRVEVIAILSSIYVSSALFPAYLIARRLFTSDKLVIACCILTALSTDMCYSMTFLSESVYFPLSLWLVWILWKTLDCRGPQSCCWAFFAGLLCYVDYLAKEVALGFAIAYLAMLAVRIIRARKTSFGYDLTLFSSERMVIAVSGASFLCGFIILFVLMKATLFAGLLNSYNQTSLSVFSDPYTCFYTFYAFISDSTHWVLGFAFFPLAFALMTWPRLAPREKSLYVLCALTFVIELLCVVYTISIREDLGNLEIRQHLRYASALFIPLVFLFAKQLLRQDGVSVKRSRKCTGIAWGLATAMAIATLAIFGTADFSQGLDNSQFHLMRAIIRASQDCVLNVADIAQDANSVAPVSDEGMALLQVNPVLWGIRVALAAFVLCSTAWLASHKHRASGAIFVCGVIVALLIAGNIAAVQHNYEAYHVADADAQSVIAMNDYISNLDDSERVLVVLEKDPNTKNNYLDTYLDNSSLKLHYLLRTTFAQYVYDGRPDMVAIIDECDVTSGDNIYGSFGRVDEDFERFSYIVIQRSERDMLSDIYVEDVDLKVQGSELFCLCRVKM